MGSPPANALQQGLVDHVTNRSISGRSGEGAAYPPNQYAPRPTLPRIMLSPERDRSISHLVLPPIRDAGLREDSLGSAPALSSHLVLPSTDSLPGTTANIGPSDQPRHLFPFIAVTEGPHAPAHVGARPLPSPESAGSRAQLQGSVPSHQHSSQLSHDSRQDINPFAFAEYGNSPRQRLEHWDMDTVTSPLRTHAESPGEPSNVRDFTRSEVSPRGYESVSAPPTAMQDGSPRNILNPRRETFYPPSQPTQNFTPKKRSVTDTRYVDYQFAATQYGRPSTSYVPQGSRNADYDYHPHMHSYHSVMAQSPHTSAASYSPVFTTAGPSTTDGLPHHRDSRHGSDLSSLPAEHNQEPGTIVDLERRCEEIATNCHEILQNLEGTEHTRSERKRRMVRASHEIVDQLKDLAYHASWQRQPPGPTQTPLLAHPTGMHPNPDPSSTLDVVTRLERTNPEAAAQAARDMAAIRARTHGNFLNPPAEESRKEREK